jgi:coenzyme F420 biosynthesis associated uncharacterized protein
VPGPPLVDWSLAERIGTRLAGRSHLARPYLPGARPRSAHPPVDLTALQAEMDELRPLAEALVTDSTGLQPAGAAVVKVVDRPEWVSVNLAAFQRLLAPLLERWEERVGTRRGVGAQVAGRVAAVELGSLLGWMSTKVLGQYDLLITDRTDDVGDVVYLVGPNVVGLERRFGFAPAEFRLWVLLHELTHRAQFTGVPWLAPHFTGLVHEALTLADPDPRQLAEAARVMMRDRAEAKRRMDQGGVLALVASADQQAALNEIGGMMALLEGHGDVTMDRAAAGRVPSADRFGNVLKARRHSGSPAIRLFRKLTGLEGKLSQYEQGEEFIARIERAAGTHAVDLCWEGPTRLPSLDEIRQPERWLERMGLAGQVA